MISYISYYRLNNWLQKSSFNYLLEAHVPDRCHYNVLISFHPIQTEIAKRLSALINQLLPCLQPEHQQSVVQAVERAKQVTMAELNAIIGVSILNAWFLLS